MVVVVGAEEAGDAVSRGRMVLFMKGGNKMRWSDCLEGYGTGFTKRVFRLEGKKDLRVILFELRWFQWPWRCDIASTRQTCYSYSN